MQTFLPYADFLRSAQAIDKKRCWKQVIEAKQIIDTLIGMQSDSYKELSEPFKLKQFPWKNHPAVKMWGADIEALKYYFNCYLLVNIKKHKINTKYKPYSPIQLDNYLEGCVEPLWWMGNEDFHRAMRARLIEKKPEFYEPLWPEDKGFNNGKYLWPDMETKTFKII
jgi:hypothetical protein